MKTAKKKTSIKDIAREADVSISTVSHVINKSKYVSEETQEKVRKAIKKLDYRPNIIARSLRTRKTKTIGVMLPDIAQPFFAQVVRGMEQAAKIRNYTLVLGCTFYDLEEEKKQINSLIDQSIDGLVFFCGYDSYDHIKEVHENHVPVVVVDRELSDKSIPSVLIDNKLAMQSAVEYLIGNGHSEIGYITFPFGNQTTIKRRYQGYLNALKKNNLKINKDYIVIDDSMRLNELQATYEIMKTKIANNMLPTAFAVLADFLAIGLIKALKELNFHVPENISVIGFNNESICEFSDPPLTTVKQPKKLMGSTAVNLLLDIIEGKEVVNKNIFLPTEIIVRKTVAPPNSIRGMYREAGNAVRS